MTQNGIRQSSQNGKTLLLCTGNIMTDGDRGGILNTSMSKSNAELVNSLRHIKPQDDEDRQWQWKEGSTIRLQNPDSEDELLTNDAGRADFEITVKLFFLPGGKSDVESRKRFADDALASVANTLGVDKFDTLILSLPGIVLEKDEDDYNSKEFPVPEQTQKSWAETWKIMESLQSQGKVKSLGIAEFGILRLGSFLPHIDTHPSIDQINLRDCCDVPADLLEYTRKMGIKLMPHMDEDDPLPGNTLQQVLDELDVKERVTELRWVVKYTAIVKERGVVENKGYIVSAGVA